MFRLLAIAAILAVTGCAGVGAPTYAPPVPYGYGIGDYYGSQTNAGMGPPTIPTGAAGGNSVH